MIKTYLEKLEYYKILDTLSNYSSTYLGKELCKHTLPSYSYEEVSHLQMEITEAFSLLERYGLPSIASIPEINLSLKRLESNNSLSIQNILEINHILKLSKNLHDDFYSHENLNIEDYPILHALFSTLYFNSNLSKEIDSKLLDENTIDDKASPKLFELRKKQRKLEEEIKNKLLSFLHSNTYSKYIQEAVITLRNNRYVIPVKEEYRSHIKGLIHDISSSGSTVFIEPISIFDKNNEINNLKIEEAVEIERILQELCYKLSNLTQPLKKDIELIGKLDYLFAKAKYAKSIDATPPMLSQQKIINLKQARNPLIDKKEVVPIDIHIGDSFQTLVITGPNTGGKTVALKTVGLLILMVYSGLYIPTKQESIVPIFDMVFADIGDEQSIQESLSTFSAHMKNIIDIIQHITPNSLILLDELGSGTDPIEGSRLAISLLEYFHHIGCLTFATTHYSEMKQYALVTEGFENASSEFDLENLKPTYHLIIGIPGNSNAFAISKKLGLKEDIIDKAKSLMDIKITNMEDLLKSIHDNKLIIEHEKKNIEKKTHQIDLLKKSLERDNKEIQLKEKEMIDKAKLEARNILLKAKEQASIAIRNINQNYNSSSNTTIKNLNNIRNDLNNSIKNTLEKGENIQNETSLYNLQEGMYVYITTLNQYGTIQSISKNSNQIQVQIGNNKLTIDKQAIIPTKEQISPKKQVNHVHYTTQVKGKSGLTEINVLGYTIDEATYVIDKFLDDASLAHINSVRIVHGKGTGALKNGIHQFLKNHSHVKSFRLGAFGEGEMGVTIVEIK